MNGTLTVETLPDQGSTFTFTMKVPVDRTPETDSERWKEGERLKGSRVLMISPSALQSRFLSEACPLWGAQVEIVHSPDEARRVLARGGESRRVVLDVDRPVISVEDALSFSSRSPSPARFICLGRVKQGYPHHKSDARTLFLAKPLTLGSLFRALLDADAIPATRDAAAPLSGSSLASTSFVKRSPLSAAAASVAALPNQTVKENDTTTSLRVMVVGEEFGRQPSLVQLLSALGHRGQSVPTAKFAIETFRRQPCDLLLIRMDPSATSCADTLNLFRRGSAGDTFKGIPAIAFHLKPGGPSREECFSLGFSEVLSNADQETELARALAVYSARTVRATPIRYDQDAKSF